MDRLFRDILECLEESYEMKRGLNLEMYVEG